MQASSDFRDAAARESAAIVRGGPGGDPLRAALSLCIAVTETFHNRRPSKAVALGKLIFAVMGFIGLMILVYVLLSQFDFSAIASPMPQIAKVFLGIMAGSVFLVAVGYFDATMTRRSSIARLRDPMRRGLSLFDTTTPEVLFVHLEDGNTFSKAKLFPDDDGFMLIDQRTRALLIEGERYRYIILAENIEAMQLATVHGRGAIDLTYRIGSTSLRLAIYADGLSKEIRAGVTLYNRVIDDLELPFD
ncbi:MAG: hypothetical protein WD768_18315 [Phycisphaeraceae bacterium]